MAFFFRMFIRPQSRDMQSVPTAEPVGCAMGEMVLVFIQLVTFDCLRRPSSSGLAPRAEGLQAPTMKVVRRLRGCLCWSDSEGLWANRLGDYTCARILSSEDIYNRPVLSKDTQVGSIVSRITAGTGLQRFELRDEFSASIDVSHCWT